MGWQPISTAPRDGTDILVWGPRGHCHLVVAWDGDAAPPFRWATLDGPFYPEAAFTHWQPLPEPPS